MPVGLSPNTGPPIKFKSVAISSSYLSLSMLGFTPKAVGAATYPASDRRVIWSVRTTVKLCYHRKIELNYGMGKFLRDTVNGVRLVSRERMEQARLIDDAE